MDGSRRSIQILAQLNANVLRFEDRSLKDPALGGDTTILNIMDDIALVQNSLSNDQIVTLAAKFGV